MDPCRFVLPFEVLLQMERDPGLRFARRLFAIARDGGDEIRRQVLIAGPKVMLINEYAGSGGDAMPWYFRRAGIGKLIGKRTWGGLIGRAGAPDLIDLGVVTAPSSGVGGTPRGSVPAMFSFAYPCGSVAFRERLTVSLPSGPVWFGSRRRIKYT